MLNRIQASDLVQITGVNKPDAKFLHAAQATDFLRHRMPRPFVFDEQNVQLHVSCRADDLLDQFMKFVMAFPCVHHHDARDVGFLI